MLICHRICLAEGTIPSISVTMVVSFASSGFIYEKRPQFFETKSHFPYILEAYCTIEYFICCRPYAIGFFSTLPLLVEGVKMLPATDFTLTTASTANVSLRNTGHLYMEVQVDECHVSNN